MSAKDTQGSYSRLLPRLLFCTPVCTVKLPSEQLNTHRNPGCPSQPTASKSPCQTSLVPGERNQDIKRVMTGSFEVTRACLAPPALTVRVTCHVMRGGSWLQPMWGTNASSPRNWLLPTITFPGGGSCPGDSSSDTWTASSADGEAGNQLSHYLVVILIHQVLEGHLL